MLKKFLLATLVFTAFLAVQGCRRTPEYTVTLESDYADAVLTVDPSEKVEEGTEVEISATDPEGTHEFVHWLDEDESVISTDATFQVTIEEDRTFQAVFIQSIDEAALRSELETALAPPAEVTSDLDLAESHVYEGFTFAIAWASDDESVISPDGTVTRPAVGASDASVTLTATATHGERDIEIVIDFTTLVKAQAVDETALRNFLESALAPPSETIDDITLIETETYEELTLDIEWASDNEDVIAPDGTVTRPEIGEDDAEVQLTATITDADGLVSMSIDFLVIVYALQEEEPTRYLVTLESDHPGADFTIDPAHLVEEGTEVTIGVTDAHDTHDFLHWLDEDDVIVSTDATFSITVDADMTFTAVFVEKIDEEALKDDFEAGVDLPEETVTDLSLPDLYTYRDTEFVIEWSSDDETVIATDGTITRPGVGEDDAVVTLTAIITDPYGRFTTDVTFIVTVLAEKDVDASVYQIENGGFETGDLTGWTILYGEAFEDEGVSDAETDIAYDVDTNKDGDYFYGRHNEGAVGAMRSSDFEIGGSGWISFKMGGGMNVGLVYIRIVEAETGEELARFGHTEFNSSTADDFAEYREANLVQYIADISEHMGKTAYIEVVNNARQHWGIVTLDSFETYHEIKPHFPDEPFVFEAEDIKPEFDMDDIGPEPENVRFETGDLTGWSVAYGEEAFQDSHVRDMGDHYRFINRDDEGEVGVMRSDAFVVSDEAFLSMRIGAAHDNNRDHIYVSVRRVGTNEEIFRTYNDRGHFDDEEATHLYHIDLEEYKGEKLYLEVVVNATEMWGLIILEEIYTHYEEVPFVRDEIALNLLDLQPTERSYSVMREQVQALIADFDVEELLVNIDDEDTKAFYRENFETMFLKNFFSTIDGFTVNSPYHDDPLTFPGVNEYLESGHTFTITGDIPAMWLRDAPAQIMQYLHWLEEDEDVQGMVKGMIERLFMYIRLDPYANAFNIDGSVWERKWEIDSLCYPIWLAYEYWQITGDDSIFDRYFEMTVDTIIDTFIAEQNHDDANYSIRDHFPHDADRYPLEVKKGIGLIYSAFRPSDDVTMYKYLIPSNMFAVSILRYIDEIYTELGLDADTAERASDLADEVEDAIYEHGTYEHEELGTIFAYEVDGLGNYNLMDDANIPSLLSAPWLGFVEKDDPIYLNTRDFILSPENPWYFEGPYARGIGSEHTPHYDNENVWPMALAYQMMTTDDPDEVLEVLEILVMTTGGTLVMHEGFNANNPNQYSREWFTWPCALFAEAVLMHFLLDERAPRLDTPENLTFDDGLLTWDEVDHAAHYQVMIDQDEFDTALNEFTIPIEYKGELHISVRAISDTEDYRDSRLAEISVYIETESLDKVENIVLDDDELTFDAVTNAEEYEIYVNGELFTTITATTYTLPTEVADDPQAYIQVRAIALGYDPSPMSGRVYVNVEPIATEAELLAMDPFGTYLLVDDIELTAPWTPMDFFGRFDGAGHAITNVVIAGDHVNTGFFGHLEEASVFNLTLVGEMDSTFTALEPNVGVLAGLAQGSTIENVHIDFTIDIESTNGVGKLGGLVGHLQYTNIADSSFTGTIDATHFATGGLVGRATNPEEASSIERSFVEADITVTGGEMSYAGGFLGYMNVNTLTIRESYAHVDVTGPTYVGGFVAYLGSGFVEDSYARGSVTATSSFLVHAGGFIGRLEGYNALVKNAISSVLVETDHENDYIRAGAFVGTTPGGTFNTMYENCVYDSLVSDLDRIGNPATGRGDGIRGEELDHTTLSGFSLAIWDFSGEKPALKFATE